MIKTRFERLTIPLGTEFNNLTVIGYESLTHSYICQCRCGKVVKRRSTVLKNGSSISCKCLIDNRKLKLEGTNMGYWKILRYSLDIFKYECQCVCGTKKFFTTGAVRNGRSKSCGCMKLKLKKEYLLNNFDPENSAKIKGLYNSYKKGAKNRDLEFTLTYDYFANLIKGNCYYCNSPPRATLKWSNDDKGWSGRPLMYNGVDRINNNLGYSIDNSMTCCKICNFAKHALSHEDWVKWLKDIIKHDYPSKMNK